LAPRRSASRTVQFNVFPVCTSLRVYIEGKMMKGKKLGGAIVEVAVCRMLGGGLRDPMAGLLGFPSIQCI